MLGSWNWAKEYEIDSTGKKIAHLANFTAFANFGLAHVDDEWSQVITENTAIVRYFNLNLSTIEYKSAEVYASGKLWKPGQVVPKWSDINVLVTIKNPTDYNFSDLSLHMDINNNKGFAWNNSIYLSPNGETVGNISWKASLEGPLSLKITTNLVLSSSNDNLTLSLSKFIEVGIKNSEEKESGDMLALFCILIILTVCSYMIYSGMEDIDLDSKLSENESDSDESVNEDEHRREFALPDDSSEEE